MLFATDLDGTLLKPQKPIGVLEGHNRDFLIDLNRRGWSVALVSGRNANLREPLQRDLGFPVIFVGCNGGFTLDEEGRLIRKVALSRDLLLQIYATMVDRYGISAWAAMDETVFNYFDIHDLSRALLNIVRLGNFFSFSLKEKYSLKRDEFLHRLTEGGVCKLMAVTGLGKKKIAQAQEAYVVIRDLIGDRCSVTISSFSIEMTAKEARKGLALEELCQKRGIDRNDVYVVGDSGNDISMFDTFPHSFCMRRAAPWIRAHAAHTVDRVSDIAEYLKHPETLDKDLETFEERRKMPLGPTEVKN